MGRRIQIVISILLPVLLTTNFLPIVIPLAHGQQEYFDPSGYKLPQERVPLYMSFSSSPDDSTDEAVLKLGITLLENDAETKVKAVTYAITLTDLSNGTMVLRDVFHSESGIMNILLARSDGETKIGNSFQEQFLNAWVTENEFLIASRWISENASYAIKIELLGVDNIRNLLDSDSVPRVNLVVNTKDDFATRIPVGSPITVVTDKEAYQPGEHIIVTGMVEHATDEPMLFRLYNPNGALARADLIRVNDNGTYAYEFPTGGRLMAYTGEYQILINYGGREMRTYFNFSEVPSDCWLSVEVAGDQFTIRCRIINGSIRSISADIEKMMLIVNVQSSNNNEGSLMLELPKELILSQDITRRQDRPFTVFVNGLEAIAVEHEGGKDDRIIEIPFDAGQSRIEIVGTWIAPEFGPTAFLIALVSVAAILVAISRLTRPSS